MIFVGYKKKLKITCYKLGDKDEICLEPELKKLKVASGNPVF